MFKRMITLLIVTGVLAATAACTSTPRLSRHWGQSVQTARQQQIVNAQAGKGTSVPADLDGQAAEGALSKYHQRFKAPTTP